MRSTVEKKKILYLIQKGIECENQYHNLRKACEYYKEAKTYLAGLYGKESRLCNFVNLYDYVWDMYQEDYRAAALKLADVGELLESFSEWNIVDDFTEWIYENKQDLLKETVAKTLDVIRYFDFEYSFEDIVVQAMLSGNDTEEIINRTLIDQMGLPRKFHYLLQQMCKDVKACTPDMKRKAFELYDFWRNNQDKDFSQMDNEEKKHLVNSLYDLLQEADFFNTGNENMSGGFASFINSNRNRIEFDIARGMAGLGEIEFAESVFSKLKGNNVFEDNDSQIKIKLLDCLLEYKKGYKKSAEKILDEIVELENNLIMQVFFMREEQRKIEFLKGIEYLMKRTAEVCYQVCGEQAAYSMVVRTRTLSFDHASIHLSSEVHAHAVAKAHQLELRKKAGEDITAEYTELLDYFEKISQGIFEFDSMKICRKLTDKQVVLEFTVMTDERDYDYYYVFVVTSKSISAINLGKCEEVNKCIAGIRKYITDYAAGKFCIYQIRMLPQYHELYQTVLLPISEVLPQNIHNLLIAGAGDFLELPFGMLPCFHWYDQYMEDKYQICYINSGKELLRDENPDMNQEAVVIGNPDFKGTYPELPSSAKEVEVVAKLLKVEPVTGKAAVPECLKRPAGIVHISTHSYPEKGDFNREADPMERVGLVFAGGQGLSARKISQIDMSRTNLVVLSVCGTEEEKGVYSDIGPGIRRAFINAGVRHIVLNLWKTDDCAAELLMQCFYDCFIGGKKSIDESLRDAKHYLRSSSVNKIRREQYYDESMEAVFALMKDDEIPYVHPYYWAGFIAFGV